MPKILDTIIFLLKNWACACKRNSYIKAFLLGEELPEVKNFNPDSEACCQEEWLAQVESEIAALADTSYEEYNESDEGVGYLTKKYTFAKLGFVPSNTSIGVVSHS